MAVHECIGLMRQYKGFAVSHRLEPYVAGCIDKGKNVSNKLMLFGHSTIECIFHMSMLLDICACLQDSRSTHIYATHSHVLACSVCETQGSVVLETTS